MKAYASPPHDDVSNLAVPAAREPAVEPPAPVLEVSAETDREYLDGIIAEIDKKLEGKEGVSLAHAWRYREEVRAKYELPECGGRWEDPQAYINAMEDLLAKRGVALRGRHEFTAFFEKNPTAAAVAMSDSVFRDTTVVAQATSTNDWWGLRARANQLAHESVHAFQFMRYPRMPDDEGEREAYYYQMLTPQQILKYRDNPEFLHHLINGGIERSVQNSVARDARN